MQNNMRYSVSQVSKLAGVTIKTLHHYDEKGLLIPHRNPENGYREYDQNHLVRLQQILIYRELDFSIEQIKSMLAGCGDDILFELNKQKDILLQRQQSLSKMINSLEVTMTNVKGQANYDIMFEDIPKEKVERWDKMTRERFGDELIEKEREVFAKFDPEQMKAIKEETDKITRDFAKTIGRPADDDLVQQITKQHYDSLNRVHLLLQTLHEIPENEQKPLEYERYIEMANSVDEQEMHEICEYYGEGYAEHARQAMLFFADKHLK